MHIGNAEVSMVVLVSSRIGRFRGSTSRTAILLIIAALFFSTGAAIVALHTRAARGGDEGIIVDEAALDLGAVWMQEDYEVTLPIRNTTEQPITISQFKSSCGCVCVEPSSLVLPARATRDVKVRLNLLPRTSEENKRGEFPFSVPLVPVVKSDLPPTAIWLIHGTVRKVFRERMSDVDFGDSCIYGKEFPVRSVKLQAVCPLTAVRTESPYGADVCQVAPLGADGSVFALLVGPPPDLPPGTFAFPVSVFCAIANQADLCAGRFTVFGKVVSDVEVTPELLLLGAVAAGKPSQRYVWLRSRSGREWEATAEEGKGVAVEPRETKGDSEQPFRITIVPDAGPHNTTVRFQIRQRADEYSLEMPVKYVGLTESQGAPSDVDSQVSSESPVVRPGAFNGKDHGEGERYPK